MSTLLRRNRRGRRIVTKTRLQAVFGDLENQWLEAVQAKDKVVLDKLLAETFEVWSPTQGDPIPLEDWRQQAFAHPPQGFQILQMAVRAVKEDVAVVSFVLRQNFTEAGKGAWFVVDVWIKDGDTWRCTDRYLSEVPAGKPAREDVKPSGKQ